MPQIELKYSDDITLDTEAIFSAIEHTINGKDSTAGVCKSRAFPVKECRHSHLYISVMLLKKPHRDGAFMQSLAEVLKAEIMPLLIQNCYFSLSVDFISDYYITEYFQTGHSQIN